MKRKFVNIFCMIIAFFVILTFGCNSNVENDNNLENGKSGFYFGAESLLPDITARTALPNIQDIQAAYSEIKLYKKLTTSAFDYEPVVTYEKFSDILQTAVLFEVEAGSYNFKLTLKVNGADYEQERTNVNITATPILLKFDALAPTELNGKGSINITFKAYNSSLSGIEKVTAKFDNESESAEGIAWTNENDGILGEGNFEKSELTEGKHKILFYFKDKNDTTLLTYPVSAYVYANLTSKDDFSISIGSQNTFDIYTVTYNVNGGEGVNKTQKFNPKSKLLSFVETSFSAPTDKNFLCWNTKADGSGTIYNEYENPSISENLTLYAQYLAWDTINSAYEISTVDDLTILFKTKKGLSDKAILKKSLRAGDWIPIEEYLGTFDGNGNALQINATANDAAFIKTLKGTIKNLTFESSKFTGTTSAATFASTVESGATISNCVANTNTIIASSTNGVAGGIAAVVKDGGTISDCKTLGGSVKATSVSTFAKSTAGGIAGNNEGTISFGETCNVTASISASSTSSSVAGGIVGYNSGEIAGNGSVHLSSISGGKKGNVIGDFTESSKISSSILLIDPLLPISSSYFVSVNSGKYVSTFILEKKTNITLSVKDNAGDAAVWAYIVNENNENKASTGKINATTITVKADNLETGEYKIYMKNENIVYDSKGEFTITVE